MDKFLEWMRNKQYLVSGDIGWWPDFVIRDDSIIYSLNYLEDLPKQIIIGYMLQYINENRLLIDLMPQEFIEIFEQYDIEKIYRRLEEIINE